MLDRVYACVLAGGQSSRFGSDKARALLKGVPLIMHAIAPAQFLGIPFFAVADEQGKYDDLGIQTLEDRETDRGPLEGLATALQRVPNDAWVLFLACDMICVQPAWIKALMETAAEQCNGGADIIRFKARPIQPFVALYHAYLADSVTVAVWEGQRSLRKYVRRQRQSVLPQPDDWHLLRNINTPEDLHKHA